MSRFNCSLASHSSDGLLFFFFFFFFFFSCFFFLSLFVSSFGFRIRESSYSRTIMARKALDHENMFEIGVVQANEC